MNETIRFDITIDCGADYETDFQFTEDDENTLIDMTGWSVEAQLREFPESRDCLDFTCSADTDGFHISMSGTDTAQIGYTLGFYDVFITDPYGNRTKLVKGRAFITPRTTR